MTQPSLLKGIESPRVLTVSELTFAIKELVEGIGEVVVEGEVSNVRVPPSGHIYFTLKDEVSQIRAVIFQRVSVFLTYLPENGQKVVVKGRLNLYERRGEYQIIVEELLPSGLGELQKRFEELKKKLEREGLFRKDLKKPLPRFPRKIGIITSPSGAAVRDILKVLRRRFPSIPVLLYPVHVQGERAVEEIVKALEYMGDREDLDVIIVGRGGGSVEDLWAFNEEVVARAIFRCPKPVISAVGHEIDYTISDYVADVRAPTPSAAAEMVVRDRLEVLREIEELRARMVSALVSHLKQIESFLHSLRSRLRDPATFLDSFKLRCSEAQERLFVSAARVLEIHSERFKRAFLFLIGLGLPSKIEGFIEEVERNRKAIESKLDDKLRSLREALTYLRNRLLDLSPYEVLKRGYSIVKDSKGRVITSVEKVSRGDMVEVVLHDGAIRSIVQDVLSTKD